MLLSRSMLMAGGGGPLSVARWNGATTTGETLTDSDRTFESAGSTAMIRTTTTIQFGTPGSRLYFEVAVVALTGGDERFGAATAGANPSNYLGSDINAFGWEPSGAVRSNGAIIATLAGYIASDVLGLAMDSTLQRSWFSKNGVWQNGDPSTGSAGISSSAGVIYGAASASSGGKFTIPYQLRFAPPQGFGVL